MLYYRTVSHPYLSEYMSNPELTIDQMLELAYGQAENLIVGNKDQIMPVFMILTEGDEIIFIGTPWQGNHQKDLAILMIKDLMVEHKAVAYSFLTEAWVAKQPKGWRPGDPSIPPSENPDREEVVLAMATNGSETKYKDWDILRDDEGNCCSLRLRKGTSMSMGRFEGLLPNTPIMH